MPEPQRLIEPFSSPSLIASIDPCRIPRQRHTIDHSLLWLSIGKLYRMGRILDPNSQASHRMFWEPPPCRNQTSFAYYYQRYERVLPPNRLVGVHPILAGPLVPWRLQS